MPTHHLTQTFHNDPEAASSARRAVRRLRGLLPAERLETLSLLVSELITNSVRHALAGPGSHLKLDVLASPGVVRVEVADRGTGFDPAHPHAEITDMGGWGLYLLDELADQWGVVQDHERGWTRVWFELGTPDRPRDEGRVHRLPSSIARAGL